MQSRTKTKIGADKITKFSARQSKFAAVMKNARKQRPDPTDHNMIFVSYLMEKGIRGAVERKETVSPEKNPRALPVKIVLTRSE